MPSGKLPGSSVENEDAPLVAHLSFVPLAVQMCDEVLALDERCGLSAWSAATMKSTLLNPAALTLGSWYDGSLSSFLIAQSLLDEAEILKIGVDPILRRQGIGRALLDSALALLSEAGIRSVWLEVRVGNTAARRLYESLGFEEISRRVGYYDDGEDGVNYRLEISRWNGV